MCSKTHWGRNLWSIFHIVSFLYEIENTKDSQNVREIFYDAKYNIPCQICRKHYSKNIKNYFNDFCFQNNENLIETIIDLHSDVNDNLGKYNETFDYYYNYWKEHSSRKRLFYHLYQLEHCPGISYDFKKKIYNLALKIKKKK